MISVVMPAFNEAAMLGASVREVVDGLHAIGQPFEVHIVENGSTDGTLALALRITEALPEVEVHVMRTADYGEALRTGLLSSRGTIGVVFDVDYYDIGFLKEALAVLDGAADPTGPVIVVGSKRAPGSIDERSLLRRAATSVFTGILRTVFGLSVSDTHGMKACNLDVLRPVIRTCRLGTDMFDTELIIRSERAGWKIAEIPVTVRETRPARTSFLRRVPRTLIGLLRLRATIGGRRSKL